MNNISIQNKLTEINNQVRTLLNNTTSIYSQRSKEAEILSYGNLSLTLDTIRRGFVFKSGIFETDSIEISPVTNNIQNLEYINDTIKVSDILTGDAWFTNEKVREVLNNYITKNELNEKYGWIDEVFDKKDDLTIKSNVVIDGTLNGLNIDEILTPDRILSDEELLKQIRGEIPDNLNYRLRVLEVDLHIRTNKYRIKELENFYFS